MKRSDWLVNCSCDDSQYTGEFARQVRRDGQSMISFMMESHDYMVVSDESSS